MAHCASPVDPPFQFHVRWSRIAMELGCFRHLVRFSIAAAPSVTANCMPCGKWYYDITLFNRPQRHDHHMCSLWTRMDALLPTSIQSVRWRSNMLLRTRSMCGFRVCFLEGILQSRCVVSQACRYVRAQMACTDGCSQHMFGAAVSW